MNREPWSFHWFKLLKHFRAESLPDANSIWEPPDSIPNSEVKPDSADDSVGFPHVKVGQCQAFNLP